MVSIELCKFYSSVADLLSLGHCHFSLVSVFKMFKIYCYIHMIHGD